MRRVVSDNTYKLDTVKLSDLLGIPEHRITGALKSRNIQYVRLQPELFRFDKPVSTIESGTAVFVDTYEVVRGFPKISRALMLDPALGQHFPSGKVAVEEKMNGYNTRIVLIGGSILGLTRGGLVCPYTTEKARLLIPREFFRDHPDLVLCGEMVGPDSPYVPKSLYGVESLEFFTFDVREKMTGKPMPVMKRRKLMDEYGIKSARFFGEFDVKEAHIEIARIIRELGKSTHEGVVIKDPEMIVSPVKYTSSESNCSDLEYAFEFYNDYGRDFFFGRVCREAFQSVEWNEDVDGLKERSLRLGESILLPMIETIKKRRAGERISENVRIRVRSLDTVEKFREYLRLLGVDAVFGEPEKVGDEYIVRIRKTYKSTSDKTESILSGGMWS